MKEAGIHVQAVDESAFEVELIKVARMIDWAPSTSCTASRSSTGNSEINVDAVSCCAASNMTTSSMLDCAELPASTPPIMILRLIKSSLVFAGSTISSLIIKLPSVKAGYSPSNDGSSSLMRLASGGCVDSKLPEPNNRCMPSLKNI